MAEKHAKAWYENIVDSKGKTLEAVYRVQEAQSEKTCEAENCVLNVRILPMSSYIRVYYPDTDVVEIFHTGCFRKEFSLDARD